MHLIFMLITNESILDTDNPLTKILNDRHDFRTKFFYADLDDDARELVLSVDDNNKLLIMIVINEMFSTERIETDIKIGVRKLK